MRSSGIYLSTLSALNWFYNPGLWVARVVRAARARSWGRRDGEQELWIYPSGRQRWFVQHQVLEFHCCPGRGQISDLLRDLHGAELNGNKLRVRRRRQANQNLEATLWKKNCLIWTVFIEQWLTTTDRLTGWLQYFELFYGPFLGSGEKAQFFSSSNTWRSSISSLSVWMA